MTAYNTYATTKGNVKNIHERLTNTDYLLAPGQYFAIDVQAKVTKTNLYWSIIKNTAEITAIQNKHEVAVEDSTIIKIQTIFK